MKEKETRSNKTAPLNIRAQDGESRVVEGYAALFETDSEILGGDFVESIDRGAFDGVIERSDVKAWLNHNPDRGILARAIKGNGTLELTIDDKGLKYRFEAPKTALGDELLEGIRRGDIAGSSFAFTVQEDKWEHVGESCYHRTITKIEELYDVSPVYDPAYRDTTVALRSLEQKKSEAEQSEKEKIKKGEDRNLNTTNRKAFLYL